MANSKFFFETTLKRLAAIFFVVVVCFAGASSTHAGTTSFWGLGGGYEILQVPDSFPESTGGGLTSGPRDIPANNTVYRDVGENMRGFSLGPIVGISFLDRYGLDISGRFNYTRSTVNRYRADGTSKVYITGGNFIFSSLAFDVGFRYYITSWAFVRAHLGKIYGLTETFDFSDSDKVKFSDSKSPFGYGAGLFFKPFHLFGQLVEPGVDYKRFASDFGGSFQEFSATVSFYFSGGIGAGSTSAKVESSNAH